MNCPTCGSRARRIHVHDDNPFHYHECSDCGWDDYDECALGARPVEDALDELDFNNDEVATDELEENC